MSNDDQDAAAGADTAGDPVDELLARIQERDPALLRAMFEAAGIGHADPNGWITEQAEQLGRLEQPHAAKKRATVIALVQARLAGEAEAAVFRRPDTCSKTIYYSKWQKDPTFADVLARIETAARTWHDETEARALALASRRLATYSPAAAMTAYEQLAHPDPHVKLRAAFGILDRAGLETGAKSTQQQIGQDLDAWRAQAEERRRQAAEAAAMLDQAEADRAEAEADPDE